MRTRPHDLEDAHRAHGLHRPWDPLQVTSWGLIVIFLVFFYTFNGLFLRFPLEYVLSVLYGGCSLLTVILNVLTARSDASDPAIWRKLSDQEMFTGTIPADCTMCQLCRAYVHKSSKHCGRCNKCVIGFDHHCKWLNNCVGGNNYRLFFVFVTVTLGTLGFHTGIGLYQFVDSFLDPDHYRGRLQSLYGTGDLIVFRASDGFIMVLALIATALLCHLFGFHVMLNWRGQTTYEWIINRRQRQRGSLPPPSPAGEDKGAGDDPRYGEPEGVDRYVYYEAKPAAAAEPNADGSRSTRTAERDPSSDAESGDRSGSAQSVRSSQNARKTSSSQKHSTPKSPNTPLDAPQPKRLSRPSDDVEAVLDTASTGDLLPLPRLPPMPPPLPYPRTPPGAGRKTPDGDAPDRLDELVMSDLPGPLLVTGRPEDGACCTELTEMLLSQEASMEVPGIPVFPRLNAPPV